MSTTTAPRKHQADVDAGLALIRRGPPFDPKEQRLIERADVAREGQCENDEEHRLREIGARLRFINPEPAPRIATPFDDQIAELTARIEAAAAEEGQRRDAYFDAVALERRLSRKTWESNGRWSEERQADPGSTPAKRRMARLDVADTEQEWRLAEQRWQQLCSSRGRLYNLARDFQLHGAA
jgi:hypothetical protein